MAGKRPKRAVAQCDSCGDHKNDFGDLRRMTKRVEGRIETENVCASKDVCRAKSEKKGYRA